MTERHFLEEQHDFSLVLGGPIFHLFRRSHLIGDGLELVHRRLLTITLVAWLPLLLLATLGSLAGNVGRISFFHDVEVHVRFLIALPVLVAAELLVHSRIRPAVRRFVERRIVLPWDLPRFDKAIESAIRLRNSIPVEVTPILFVYTVGLRLWHSRIRPDTPIDLPFLGKSAYAFGPTLFAQGAMLAGLVASRVLYRGESLLSFKLQIEKDYKAAVLAILDPLLMFASQTARAKRKGLADYGSLAQRHVQSFEPKGVLRDPGPSEERLGAGDIQSLAELGNSYALVREMRAVPFGLKEISRLAATAAPLFASITHNPQKNSLFASSSSCFEDPSRQPRQRIVSEQP